MPIVSEKIQQAAAEKLAEALDKMDGVESSVDVRTSGTQNRPIVNASVSPENWRKVAEDLKNKYESQIKEIWNKRQNRYSELRLAKKNDPSKEKVEMYYIGG